MKRVTAVAAALVAMLAVAVGNASAQGTGTINIGGVEAITNLSVDVIGSGVCGFSGPASLEIELTDLTTGITTTGFGTVECQSPNEHVNWVVAAFFAGYRPGDRVLVDATAAGAIIDADQRTTVIKQFH